MAHRPLLARAQKRLACFSVSLTVSSYVYPYLKPLCRNADRFAKVCGTNFSVEAVCRIGPYVLTSSVSPMCR